MNIPPEVRKFLEGLLNDSGMLNLDETTREEMIKELYARLDNYVASVLSETIPPEHFEAFIKLNEEKKSQEEVQRFLQERVPNIGEVFKKAFADFREMYLSDVAVARNAPQEQSNLP